MGIIVVARSDATTDAGALNADDHIDAPANQIGHQHGQKCRCPGSFSARAIFDRDVLALDIAALFEGSSRNGRR